MQEFIDQLEMVLMDLKRSSDKLDSSICLSKDNKIDIPAIFKAEKSLQYMYSAYNILDELQEKLYESIQNS